MVVLSDLRSPDDEIVITGACACGPTAYLAAGQALRYVVDAQYVRQLNKTMIVTSNVRVGLYSILFLEIMYNF